MLAAGTARRSALVRLSTGGLARGWRTPAGRAVEAGTKGFWDQYPCIDALCSELGVRDALTPPTTSAFWSLPASAGVADGQDGDAVMVADAPVLGKRTPRLPAGLGQAWHTRGSFPGVPVLDRASLFALLPWFSAQLASEEARAALDAVSFRELCSRAGLSRRAYERFVRPLLLVALFAPPEQVSAGVALDCLRYYALEHQASFDVRWCRGSVAERIFAPWRAAMEARHPGRLRVLGAARVTSVYGANDGSGRVGGVRVEVRIDAAVARAEEGRDGEGGSGEPRDGVEEVDLEADAVVLAVGVNGCKAVVHGSPLLSRHAFFRRFGALSGIDVASARLWLRTGGKPVPTRFPSNVLSGPGLGDFTLPEPSPAPSAKFPGSTWSPTPHRGSPPLVPSAPVAVAGADAEAAVVAASRQRSAASAGGWRPGVDAVAADAGASFGATLFDLSTLQPEEHGPNAAGNPEGLTVIGMDFYNAGELLALSDRDAVTACVRLLRRAAPELARAMDGDGSVGAWGVHGVEDAAFLRFPGAVTRFGPGTRPLRPTQGTPVPGLWMAGDWVRGVPCAARGLSQERALATGLRAGELAADGLGLPPTLEAGVGGPESRGPAFLDADAPEPHVALADRTARAAAAFIALAGRGPLKNALPFQGAGGGGWF